MKKKKLRRRTPVGMASLPSDLAACEKRVPRALGNPPVDGQQACPALHRGM